MKAFGGARAARAGLTVAAGAVFVLFYLKYVPLVGAFQAVLAPVLLAGFALTAARREWGVLFFVFCFPLINNLPYFFRIYDTTPHAPTALVLFLVIALGWLTGSVVRPPEKAAGHPVLRPASLFLAAAAASAVITGLRFANFFPFRGEAVHELIVNVNGVRAGGALMSDVFAFLNYLTGPVFFIIILPSLLSQAGFLRRVLTALSVSAGLALIFSAVQKYHSPSLGNYPFFIRLDQINATFKDPNSFGAFLSYFIPLALGAALTFRGWLRWLSMGLAGFSLVMFPAVGARSPFGALAAGLAVFAALALARMEAPLPKKLLRAAAALTAAAGLIGLLFAVQGRSILARRVAASLGVFSETTSPEAFFNRRLAFWRAAVAMTEDYPLTGVGLGAFVVELPNYLRTLGTPMKATDSALNHPLQVAAELGLVGLLLLAWLALEVLRQLVRSWRSCPPDRKYLLAGVISGLAAFAVNFMFQTYIGSYEIKASLWLLIALAVALGGEASWPSRVAQIGRRASVPGLALVAVFGLVHAWNSTHSLSLEHRTADLGIRQEFGLDKVETTPDGRGFRWSGKTAALTVTVSGPTLEIPLHASHPDIGTEPVLVRIYRVTGFFEGRSLLTEARLKDNSWSPVRVMLPDDTGRDVVLLIEVSRTWNPGRALGVPDPRNLGVAVGAIRFL